MKLNILCATLGLVATGCHDQSDAAEQGSVREALATWLASQISYTPAGPLTATNVQGALDQSAARTAAVEGAVAALAPVARSGAYADLTGKPDLGAFASHADVASVRAAVDGLAPVARSGAYADLSGKPSLDGFATHADLATVTAAVDALAPVAQSGAYADLTGTPDLSGFATHAEVSSVSSAFGQLAAVATSGAYADLSGKPDLSGYATTAQLAGYASTDALAWESGDGYIDPKIADPADVLSTNYQASLNGCSQWPLTTIMQSYTATASGSLAQAGLAMAAPKSDVTFEFREGEGFDGALLYASVVDLVNGQNLHPISGVEVVAGSKYTIVYAVSQPQEFKTVCSIDNNYLGGRSAYASGDYGFATYLGVDPQLVIDADGQIGLGTTAPTAKIDVATGPIRMREPASPAPGSSCNQGDVRWDENYVYVCVAANRWKRSALSSY